MATSGARPHQSPIDVDTIKYIQQVFREADKNGGGDLDEEEFIAAFTGKLNSAEGGDAVRTLRSSVLDSFVDAFSLDILRLCCLMLMRSHIGAFA